jgi:RNA polymerase sigma-70 factor (ECF subfamily)
MGLHAVAEEKTGGSTAETALREHAAVLGRVCMALTGDRAAAEQALERVAREAGQKPLGDKPKVTLLGFARVACATHASRTPLGARSPRPSADTRADDAPATERVGSAEDARIARDKLAKLKPTEREAVVLTLVGGLDATDVAAACGVDLGTAKTRIARGLSQLMEGT